MNLAAWAVVTSLVLGSLRAAQLLRASTKVEAVNAVVLATLASGRGHELPKLLARSGAAVYLTVARSLVESLDQLSLADQRDVRERLQKDAQVALLAANRRLQRHAWLDALSLAAFVLAGAGAVTGPAPSPRLALGLVAATLLWFSNAYGARSTATRMVSGALALVNSLTAFRKVEGRHRELGSERE